MPRLCGRRAIDCGGLALAALSGWPLGARPTFLLLFSVRNARFRGMLNWLISRIVLAAVFSMLNSRWGGEVCTKQLFCFQAIVRKTRTPAFISLQMDWERQVSAFSKNFCEKRTSVA